MKNPPVKVLFRMFRGEVLALFPTECGTNDPGTCMSYEHVWQHGSADCAGIIRDSRPASRAEFAPLARELRRIGYRLDIRKRSTRHDYTTRKAQISNASQPPTAPAHAS